MKKIFLILTLTFIIFSCRGADCFTPPETTVFEFVNANNENIIKNGTIDVSKIIIQENVGNGDLIGMQVKKSEDYKIIVEKIGWNDGLKNYNATIILPTEAKQFTFSVKSSKLTECGGYKIENVEFNNNNATKEAGYYKIKIE